MENDALLAPPLAAVVERLLSRFSAEIPLDAIGEETALVTGRAEDVDAVVGALEKAGRRIAGAVSEASEAGGPALLATVLKTARALQVTSGRTPTAPEIARACGLAEGDVRRALGFARTFTK
jgi:hypothetical protein